MTQYDETQESNLVLKQNDQHRQAVRQVRYEPWGLALSTSLSMGVFTAAVGIALTLYGNALAFLVGVVLLPIPALVVWWCWKAFGVERQRLANEPDLFYAPALPSAEPERDPDAELYVHPQLRPGYELNGELVAPVQESSPEMVALRGKCLMLVRGGLRRGNRWSRSKLAEGPGKLMLGSDWDEASKELQRLNYFASRPEGLVPVKDVSDILKRLELAR